MDKKSALITGGTGGLGRAVVEYFLEHGFHTYVPWLNETEKEVLNKLKSQFENQLFLHEMDVTDEIAMQAFVNHILNEHGHIDVLANLVGGFAFASLEETDQSLWNKMLTMNATSCFVCSRAVVSQMKQQGFGRIINVAAQPALHHGAANMSAYSASKAAVLNFTESLAQELIDDGITVNAIIPTIIDTKANRAAMPDADMSTWLRPNDIAKVFGFIVSNNANIVSGTAFNLMQGKK